MNPISNGSASGLSVACTFSSSTVAGTQLHISDYADPGGAIVNGSPNPASGALYHYGSARNVNVTVSRTGSTTAHTPGKITTCANNLLSTITVTVACDTRVAGTAGISPGNLAITTADINHSVEFPTSSATMTGVFINPGSFITSVVGTVVTLSKPTLAGGPLCKAGTGTGACTTSVTGSVLVSNGTNRAVTDGVTQVGGNGAVISSATAHFCGVGSTCTTPSDIGARVSGGDLPDGATITSLSSTTTATLTCTSCNPTAFTPVTAATAQILTIDPAIPPTSSRYVTNGTCANTTKTLASAVSVAGANPSNGARFAKSDIGQEIVFNPAVAAMKGARIATVTANGASATLTSPAACGATGTLYNKFSIGHPTKTAPAAGDVMGQLAISLIVDPALSPTSPPCAAVQVSGFQIELQWRSPSGATQNAITNYDTSVAAGNYQGVVVPAASIAQVLFRTSATSFGGFLKQNYTTAATTPFENGNSTYEVGFEFLPVGAGLCSGTGISEKFDLNAISVKQQQNPTFTGGGGGGIRSLSPVPNSTAVVYPNGGATAAHAVTKDLAGLVQFSGPDTNGCTVQSANQIVLGCTGNIR